MKKHLLWFCILLFLGAGVLNAQSNEDRARGAFLKAEKEFSEGNYNQALKKLEEVNSYLINRKVPRVEALYVRVYYSLKDYDQARKHFKSYFSVAETDNPDYYEILDFESKIEQKAKEAEEQNAYKISQLGNVKSIEIQTESDFEEFKENLKYYKNLEYLGIYNNELEAIDMDVSHLQNLSELSIFLTSVKTIDPSFGALSNLEDLEVYFPNDSKALSVLFLNKNIRKLELINSFTEELPDNLTSLINLEEFSYQGMVDDRYDGYTVYDPLKRFPENIGNLKKLKRLTISSTKIEALPDSFSELSALEEFNLEHAYYVQDLGENFGNLKNLKSLKIGQWDYSSNLPNLPDSFGSLEQLESLKLINLNSLETLPGSFVNLRSLKYLQIVAGLKELPSDFGSLKSLEQIELDQTKTLRELPPSMKNMDNLKYISITNKVALPKRSLPKRKSLEIVKTKV